MSSGILIRSASIDDIDWIKVQLREFADFFESKRMLFPSDDYAIKFLTLMIEHHLFLIADRDGERLGLIAGFKTLHPFNPAIKVLQEVFWWTDKNHRRSRAAAMLLDAFTEHGKKFCDWIVFTLEKNSPVSDKHLLARGYGHAEKNYFMEVD